MAASIQPKFEDIQPHEGYRFCRLPNRNQSRPIVAIHGKRVGINYIVRLIRGVTIRLCAKTLPNKTITRPNIPQKP